MYQLTLKIRFQYSLEQEVSPAIWVQRFNHDRIKHGYNIKIIIMIIFTGKYHLHNLNNIVVLVEEGEWDTSHCFFREI